MEEESNDELNELKENLEKQKSRQELFEKKVGLIGELHTRRALLANRIGRVKSESMMRHDDVEHEARKEAGSIEEEMAGVSKSITEFCPESLEDLENFRKEIHERCDAVERKIAAAEEKIT